MGRIIAATRAFFRILWTGADRASVPALPTVEPPVREVAAPKPPSDALVLLATLQREARLLDFLKEDLSAYDDSQIGAAVRDIHRDAGKTLERLFSIRPVSNGDEGSPQELPAGYDATHFRLTGRVGGSGPFRGTLRHAGWRAERVALPQFTGSPEAAQILAPAEVEL